MRPLPRKSILAVSLVAVTLYCSASAQAHVVRGHSTHGRSRSHGHGHIGFYSSYWYPYHYGFGGYYATYPYPYGYGSGYHLPDAAYLDTDISPEDASVYIDGEYYGLADDFDGFPRYLPVRPGRHSITFKSEGHRSVTRRIRVPRGALLNLKFTLPKGREPVEEDSEEIVVPDYEDRDASRRRGELEVRLEGEDEEQEGVGERDDPAPGFLRLTVAPSDASVYIDGEFYSTGARLSRLHGDLRLESGRHLIEVVRPGYRSVTRDVRVISGDRLTLDITLESTGGR